MAEFTEVMKHKERMCDFHTEKGICEYCDIYDKVGNIPRPRGCTNYILTHTQVAETIIMDWAKEHPIITNADKFKEVFGFELSCEECEYNFWNQEYKEPKEEE